MRLRGHPTRRALRGGRDRVGRSALLGRTLGRRGCEPEHAAGCLREPHRCVQAIAASAAGLPCCRTRLRYDQPSSTSAVSVVCPNTACALNAAPLPVWTVDDDIYEARPTLLIGTVDKFAQIVRKDRTARLFAVGSGAQPQLILQDELHLIAGPLGTLAGLYETALDLILSADGQRPKIIGSTATIRRAPEQVLALFDRDTCQFPPPGLDAADSGFAVVDHSLTGRLYAGVTTAGRSAKFTLQAVAASLLQTATGGLPAADRDAYFTLVTYFNSLRELGGALVLMQDDVNDTLRLLAEAHGETVRRPGAVEELTSRRTQAEILDMLDRLGRPVGAAGALDVVLATNMLSVGVDIPGSVLWWSTVSRRRLRSTSRPPAEWGVVRSQAWSWLYSTTPSPATGRIMRLFAPGMTLCIATSRPPASLRSRPGHETARFMRSWLPPCDTLVQVCSKIPR